MIIQPGLNFQHKDGTFNCVVISVRGNDNHLGVRITSKTSGIWEEDWNLEHTLSGFKDGTYLALNPFRIRTGNDEVLHKMCAPIPKDKDMTEFFDIMWESMENLHGIGLAAPQIGLAVRMIVVNAGGFKQEIINPVITKHLGHVTSKEGCLSFPATIAVNKPIKRWKQITVQGYDKNWLPIKFKLRGIAAMCVQHECDHLDGITIA